MAETVQLYTERKKEAKYHTIAHAIANQISNGEFGQGDRIESEMELAARFGVSRVTARQAVGLLKNKGLVFRKRGSGTFVGKSESEIDTISKMKNVALILPDYAMTDYYTASEIKYAESRLAEMNIGFSLVVVKSDDILSGKLPPVVEHGLCDGLLVDVIECHYYMPLLTKAHVPMVAVGNHRLVPYLSCVRFPVERVVSDICEYFMKELKKPVAFLGGPVDFDTSYEASIAYLVAMRQAQQAPVQETYCGSPEQSKVGHIQWNDAGEEVKRIVSRESGSFALITTVATVKSVLIAYKKLGISLNEYPILTIGLPPDISEEECKQIHIVPLKPESLIDLAIEKLKELRRNPDTIIHAETEYEFYKPGEFDFNWLASRLLMSSKAITKLWSEM
jgi:DNA-binding transcriptional regulator YhcF (GntR family)